MALINPTIPTIGQPNSTEDQDTVNALNTIVSAINGGLDAANLAAAAGITAAQLAASAKVLLTVDTATSTQGVTSSLADITGLSVAITPTVASYYLAVLAVPLVNNGSDQSVQVVIDVDGVSVSTDRTSMVTGSTHNATGFSFHAGSLAAGAHTIKGRVQETIGGNAQLAVTQRLYVVSWAQ